MPARLITSKSICKENDDCNLDKMNGICAKPIWDNSTKLIRIVFETEKPILYVGSIEELIYSRKLFIFF